MSDKRVEPKDQPRWRRVLLAVTTEIVGLHPRLHAYNLASSLLPARDSAERRARLLRFAGFSVGAHTQITGALKITGPRGLTQQLRIGEGCWFGPDVILDASDRIDIGNGVTIESGVMLLTSTHELDFPKHRAGPLILKPVSIGDGALLRARSIILPGVKVGSGAVVETGAVVNKDVEPNTRVGGSPAATLGVVAKP
jgi:acetyltransferase-like isoleucine patch superfamily enzyme